MTEAERAVQTLNTVRANASKTYQNAVPLATSDMNLTTFAMPLTSPAEQYEPIQNEFCKVLINKIALTIVEDKIYKGHYARLKKGYIPPLGTDIEHIYTNPINPESYDGKNLSGILSFYENDTKVAYYRRNRQDVFPISINREQLAGAFMSWAKFNSFVSNLINAVYSGNEIREEALVKSAIVGAVENNYLVQRFIDYPTENNVKEIVKEIKTTAADMAFASSKYNRYAEIAGGDVNPVVTWTPRERLVILMRNDILQTLSVEVLASAFNMTEVEFRENLILVDTFSFNEYDLETQKITGVHPSDIAFVIADEATFQNYDNLRKSASDFIASSLTYQYFLHVWQTYGVCPFSNCVVYTTQSNAKLLGVQVDNPVLEIATKGGTAETTYNYVPDTASAEMEIKVLSATKDGEPVADLSEIITAKISPDEKKITFTAGDSVAVGNYEIKYTFKPINTMFPNAVIAVGLTITA